MCICVYVYMCICVYVYVYNLKYGWPKTIDDNSCAGPLAPDPHRTG